VGPLFFPKKLASGGRRKGFSEPYSLKKGVKTFFRAMTIKTNSH
jgi:hypothetical protein